MILWRFYFSTLGVLTREQAPWPYSGSKNWQRNYLDVRFTSSRKWRRRISSERLNTEHHMARESGTLAFARTESGYRLRVQGRGTMPQSHCVQNFVAEALAKDDRVVVLDLSEADYLDSTFLGCLL